MLNSVPVLALVSASEFTMQQLVDAYNQTRVDYLVPMPMNAARLAEYVATYDVALEHSVVAMADDELVGLAMLGVRPGRTWITRLGVLPGERRQGTGRALLDSLLQSSTDLDMPLAILEVIRNNIPAHQLFLSCGFVPTRELLVLRRPPGPPQLDVPCATRWLTTEQVLALLPARTLAQAWTSECESFGNAANIQGVCVELVDGACGFLVFQKQRFALTQLTFHTTHGDPHHVGRALLAQVYTRFPELDTHTENIWASDPHLPALWELGFLEAFRRIEMHRMTR